MPWSCPVKKDVPFQNIQPSEDIYERLQTWVITVRGDMRVFFIDIRLPQGSTISSFPFWPTVDEFLKCTQDEVLWRMLFTNDIVLIAVSYTHLTLPTNREV